MAYKKRITRRRRRRTPKDNTVKYAAIAAGLYFLAKTVQGKKIIDRIKPDPENWWDGSLKQLGDQGYYGNPQ